MSTILSTGGWCLPLSPGRDVCLRVQRVSAYEPRGMSTSGSGEGVHPLGIHTLTLCRHPLLDGHLSHEMATAADGTHPTGMHSCCVVILNVFLRWGVNMLHDFHNFQSSFFHFSCSTPKHNIKHINHKA